MTPFTPPQADLVPPGVVLDTNVVLDWLVFQEPSCAALVAAIESGAVQWLASPALRAECAHVLARGVGAAHRPDLPAVWAAWDRHARMCPLPPPAPPPTRCRCRDPDDQMFVDLALHSGARWLLSHDRAVLALARPAYRLGLLIVPPRRWQQGL